jgi:hypothetical protein
MKLAFGKCGLALAVMVTLVCSSAFAAGTVTIQVVQGDQGIQGVPVEVLASDGSQSYITDQNGECVSEISGVYFRLKVNDEVLPDLHAVSEGTVVVSVAARPENGGQK